MVSLLKHLGVLILITPKIFQCIPLQNKQEMSKLTECIVKIIEKLQQKIFKVSILSSRDNTELLTNVHGRLLVPVVVNAVEETMDGMDTRLHSDLVLIQDIDADVALKEVLWHRNTKFFVILTSERDLRDVFRQFWSIKLTSVFCLVSNPSGIRLFGYQPYERLNCNSTRPILIDRWNGEEFSGDGWTAINDDVRVKNANGCPVNVSVMYVRPMALFPTNCNRSKEVDGVEARFIKVFAEVLNFTPTYSTPRDGLGWGRIRPPKGVVGEIFRRESEFGFGMLAPLLERHENIDLSRNYNDKECITFAVPVGVGKEGHSWFVNVKGGFTQLEFFLILLSILGVTLVVCVSGGLLPVSAFIYTLATCLGQTNALPKKSTVKNLILLWVLVSSVLTDIYEAALGSRMTVPLKPPNIETFQELIQSNLKLCGYSNMLDVLKVGSENPALHVIRESFNVTDFSVEAAVEMIKENRDMAYMSHMSNFQYAVLMNSEAKGHVVALEQCAYDYYPAIAMQRNSPFTKTVDKVITSLFEAGIGQHWRSLFLYDIPDSVPGVEPLHLQKSMGIFVILGVGYLLALTSFFIELSVPFVTKTRKICNKDEQRGKKRKISNRQKLNSPVFVYPYFR